jgi:TRAP transporter TAXI family solute receptor
MNRTVLIGLAATLALTVAGSAHAQKVTILGGGIKGQPYQFAVGLSKILGDHGVNATPQSAKGMVAQARLIAKGEADFAWALGGPVGAWAYKGEQRFEKEGPKPTIRAILAYPFGSLHWLTLARSGIENVEDLKGKRVSVGGASSTTQTFAHFLLPAAGLAKGDYKEFTPGFSEGFGSLRDGNVDAHLTIGKTPLAAVQELAAVKKIRLLQQDAGALQGVIDKYGPGIELKQIAADAYGANQVNDDTTNALFLYFGFSTSTHVPADTVYKVTKILYETLEAFHKTAKSASSVSLATACEGLSFPLHEGAKRYDAEIGRTDCQ